MASTLRLLLVVGALLAGTLAAACGGDDNGDNGDADQPTATEQLDGDTTPADGDQTPTGDGDGNGDGGSSFGDLPLPSGADETSSGSFSSSDIPFFVPDEEFDAEAFTNLEYKQYSVDGSPAEAIDFYKEELGDWEEVFVFSGGAEGDEGGFGVWTRDGGTTAVWIGASILDDGTDLIVILGTAD